jgi:transcriptional regulator with XRE-family HTH domain
MSFLTPQEIGQHLHTAIVKQYGTLNRCAKAIGMDNSPLYQWTKGSRLPSADNATRLLKHVALTEPHHWLASLQHHARCKATYTPSTLPGKQEPENLPISELSYGELLTQSMEKQGKRNRDVTAYMGCNREVVRSWKLGMAHPKDRDAILLALYLKEPALATRLHQNTSLTRKGKLLRDFRILSGYIRAELAALIQVEDWRIRNWEMGVSLPSLAHLRLLAGAFEVEEAWFCEEMQRFEGRLGNQRSQEDKEE